jgi:hypothetical protein
MPTLDDVARIALELSEVTEGEERNDQRSWAVAGTGFAWERTFSKADLKRFGDETPPSYPILAVRTADLAEKEAILAVGTPGVFTIQHFNGYAAILVELAAISMDALREVLIDGWLAKAPAKLAEEFTRGASPR